MAVRITRLEVVEEEKVIKKLEEVESLLREVSTQQIIRAEGEFSEVRYSEKEVVGEQELDEITEHAWLLLLGLFAQSLGLIEELSEVSLKQKEGKNGKPQTKLIEFLVGILGGIEQLNELNVGDHPIALDETIAEAWAQEVFSHYSQYIILPP